MESPAVNFPDKIVSFNKGEKKVKSLIPKLDFSSVQAKYKSEAINGKIKITQIPKPKLKKDNELEDKLKRTKEKLKKSNQIIHVLKQKVEKYKNYHNQLKTTIDRLNDNIRIANKKIENLESQLKKVGMSPSTDETFKNRLNTHVKIFLMIFS